MRILPKRPEEVFKGGEDALKRISHFHNRSNPDYFVQKLEFRKD